MLLDEFGLNKEDFLMNMSESYRLTNIKEVTIQLKDGNEITLNKELYIRKLGNTYVIFQTSPSLDYSMGHLEDIKRAIILSNVCIIFRSTPKYISKYDNIDNFYSSTIRFDVFVNANYDSRQYVTAIFIPIPHACFDLRNYVSNLYLRHGGADTSITTTRYIKYISNPNIEKVIFNDPATIVFWDDGTKTVVKTQNDETYDKEKGLSMAISKKMLGNTSKYYDTFKKWVN